MMGLAPGATAGMKPRPGTLMTVARVSTAAPTTVMAERTLRAPGRTLNAPRSGRMAPMPTRRKAGSSAAYSGVIQAISRTSGHGGEDGLRGAFHDLGEQP